MCGVVGYRPVQATDPKELRLAFCRLFEESTVRGLHAFGIYQNGAATRSFDREDIYSRFTPALPAIAHARYSTSGDWREVENNQPIVVGRTALVFNGVIHMGTREEFNRDFQVSCEGENDGEVFLRRMEKGEHPGVFLSRLSGSFAGCWFDEQGVLWAGRNKRRPLWRCYYLGAYWFASTLDILRRAGFPTDTDVTDVGLILPGVERV